MTAVGADDWHIVESIRDGFWVFDREWRCTYINQQQAELIKISKEEALGKKVWEFPEILDTDSYTQLHQAVAEQTPVQIESFYSAGQRWFEMRVYPSPQGVSILTIEITERKQTKAALRERQHFLQQLAEMSPGLLYLFDAVEQRNIYVNERSLTLLGYTPEAVLAMGADFITQVMHPEDLAQMPAHCERLNAATDGSCFELAYRMRHRNGEWRWFTSCDTVFSRTEQGQVRQILGTAQDITERKRAEEALIANKAKLRSFMDANVIGILFGDVYGGIREANDELLRIVGYTREDLEAGRLRWTEITPPEWLYLDELAIAEARSRGACTPYEKEYIRSDGSRIPVLVGYSLHGEAREESVAFIFDLSDRAFAESALRQSEERFRQFAENINDVFWMSIPNKQELLYVSRAYEQLWGRSCESLYANFFEWIESIHPNEREQVRTAYLNEAIEGGYDTEYRVVRPDGSIRWVRDRGFPIKDESGETYRAAGIAEDITDRKQAEITLQERAQELSNLNTVLAQTTTLLQERNQDLDQFAYIVSHDLKAPLRAITNLSQWIEEDLSGQLPAENQQQLQLLRERVYRMEKLINGLLAYSRVGRTETATETVDVAKLLAEVIDSLAPPDSFTLEIASVMPTLSTQKLLLNQVFANLIANAIKHHGCASGQIKISAQDQGNCYQFAVADDGQGIAPEYHGRIFAIFQTLSASQTQENTGIGLAIVKKIVERQGGTISLESQVGQGTIFRFTWPKSEP